MVEIKCARCDMQFEITLEQMKKINELKIGKLKPKDYLRRIFPFISGECEDRKGHDFAFTSKFLEESGKATQKYIEKQKNLQTLETSQKLNEGKEKELKDEKEKLTARMNEIRDELFAVDTSWTEITTMLIPNGNVALKEALDEFENITGTRDIDSWKTDVLQQQK